MQQQRQALWHNGFPNSTIGAGWGTRPCEELQSSVPADLGSVLSGLISPVESSTDAATLDLLAEAACSQPALIFLDSSTLSVWISSPCCPQNHCVALSLLACAIANPHCCVSWRPPGQDIRVKRARFCPYYLLVECILPTLNNLDHMCLMTSNIKVT